MVSLGLFLLGWLSGYVLIGAAAGLVGRRLQGVRAPAWIVPAVYMVLGGVLALYGILDRLPHWKRCMLAERLAQRPSFLLLLGFLAGINLCPPSCLP